MAESGSSESRKNTINQLSRYQDTPTKKMPRRMQEPNGVDFWLERTGYFRKHTPRDPTCLFRAVSEQVYNTQYYHIKVRKECVNFMTQRRELFEEFVTVPFDHYLEQMACFTEWGSMNEIRAISLLYKRDVVLFNGQKQTIENVTDNGFERNLLLCYTPPKQYESVYTVQYIEIAAYCQSIIYEMIYKGVFDMSNIMTTVQKMLHDRSTTFRHDRFFQRRNLDIREQLTIDLYNKVEGGHSNRDELQSDSRGILPSIPYKAVKALNPDTYRNTDFDIWHELRREVKYAGWNRHNSNELQVGGKCLINVNELIGQDGNNNSPKSETNGNNAKCMQQKLKQENFYSGYIQEMGINEEPVLVFIEELGEKRFVPHAALKPTPGKKSRQNNLTSHNKKNTVTDARRWRKTYNSSSRKRKDTISMVDGVENSSNRDGVNNNNNNINKLDFEIYRRNDAFPKMQQRYMSENHAVEDDSNYATDEAVNNSSTTVDNTQSVTNSIIQETGEKLKKAGASFTKRNADNMLSKSARSGASNNHDNSIQNSYSKQKKLDESYCLPHAGNSQMNQPGISPNLFYIFPDGSSYLIPPFLSGNFGDFNQIDHSVSSKSYNLEYFRVNQTLDYGAMTFGPDHHSIQPLGSIPANTNMNNASYVQEEIARFVNGIQNLSLTHDGTMGYNSDGKDVNTESAISKVSPCINNMQNTKQQGLSKSSANKDLSQSSEKTKQNGVSGNKGNKGNKTRYQQSNRESMAYAPYWNQYSTAVPSTSVNAYDSRIITHMPQQHLEPIMQQQQTSTVTANPANSCGPYIPPSTAVFPTLPFYPNEVAAETCYNPYYLTNGSFVSATCLPQSTLPPPPPPPSQPSTLYDTTENVATVPQSHLYSPNEMYPPAPSYPPSAGCTPMMYPPPQLQFPPLLQQQQPPTSAPNMQEHWYPMLGPSPYYVQYTTTLPPTIIEPSCNGQSTGSA